MKRQYELAVLTCVLLGFAGFSGCGESSQLSGLAPCRGTVTLGGSPVGGAAVMFVPAGSGSQRAASATTDASGNFTMGTLKPQDGVMPGDFIVTVIKHEQYGPPPEKVLNDGGEYVTPLHPTKNVLPEKYSQKGTSDIKVTVAPTGNKNINIELTE